MCYSGGVATTTGMDRDDAHTAAVEAAQAIQDLQRTITWLELPLDIQRQISCTHATLQAMATAMEREGLV